jgi:hypothetical protein
MSSNEVPYSEVTRFNERIQRLISVFLLALMMASAGITIAQVGHQIMPGWDGLYLAVIGFLITLERFYSHRSLTKLSTFSREWLVLVSTQWVVNLIVIKLFVTLSDGLTNLLTEIPRWQRSFTESFFSGEYLGALFFAILVWLFVRLFAELLDEMGLDAALIARDAGISVTTNETSPRKRLMATIFAIGGVLMFLTATGRVDLRILFANETGALNPNLSPLEAGGAGTLLYFLFGFALLSQAQYISLNTRWFLQRVPVSRSIAKRWALYSVTFLILILLIVSVLPTNYSMGFLSVLNYLINIILTVIILLFSFILAIIGFLLSLPFMLFGFDNPVPVPEFIPPTSFMPPPAEVVADGSPFPWLDLLKSILFWGVFLLVIGYSVAQYLRQHEEILQALRKIPGWKILVAFWDWIGAMFGGLNRGVSTLIEKGRARLNPQAVSTEIRRLARFTRLRNLSPRQKVFFYSHALLRRGEETGLPRGGSQTPKEYAINLERSLPTVEDEIDSITEAFDEARYSRHSIAPEDSNTVKSYWEKIRKVFQGRRG